MEIATLLEPVSEESPAGENLEYDAEFLELERAAQGKPEQVIGDHVKEAEEPDWKAVRSQAEVLLSKTKDLRVAIHFTNASLHTHGWPGLRDGLALVRGLAEQFWDTVHPNLDEDDGDPALRCNAVAELANPGKLAKGVLEVPFVRARVAGEYSLRDLRVIAGKLGPKEGDTRPAPSTELVQAALQEAGDAAAETAGAVKEALEEVQGIQTFFAGKVGELEAPDLSRLAEEIGEVDRFLNKHLGGDGVESEGAVEAATAATGGAGQAGSGSVTSRADVVRLIDRICEFYARTEPSSPVPLLLQRAKSLVDKDFMAIVADLTPSGLSEAQVFRGEDKSDPAAGWGGSGDDAGVENDGSSW